MPNVIWFDGLDSYADTTQLGIVRPELTGIESVLIGEGRFGGNAIRNFSVQGTLTLPSSYNDVWLARAMRTLSGASGEIVIGQIIDASNTVMTFKLNTATGVITVYTPGFTQAGQPVAGATGNVWVSNVWHWVEFRGNFAGSAPVGTLEIWIDGVRVLNVTGIYTFVTSINRVSVAIIDPYCRVDDIVITDGRLGDCRIQMTLPASDAGPNTGTPNSGTTHYSCVNETPGWDGNTTYLTMSSNAGLQEAFGMAALPNAPTAIFAVETMAAAEKTDAGTALAHVNLKSGATTATGASKNLLTSYTGWRDRYNTDPNTGAAWTPSAVNAAVPIYVAE